MPLAAAVPLWESILDGSIEAIVLIILMITPWLFGGYQAYHVHLACCGLALALLLWSIKQIIRWKLTLYRCATSLVLAAFFVVSSISLIPLPHSVLGWISPEAVKLYDALLPRQRELAMQDAPAETQLAPPGTTLSLYPGATQTVLVELLAAIVMFILARHGLASPARLKRLAWALVINGCVLAIFALIQRVRAPAYTIYGILVPGDPFGPFINRNHFPSYVNFAICLGMGLFLAAMLRRPGSYSITTSGQRAPTSYATSPWGEILQHPQAVWLLIPVAICFTAVLASLSRGGILALAVGIGMAFFAWRRKGGTHHLTALLLIPLFALGLLLWYGAAPTLQRIEQESLVQEGRFTIWQACWDVIKHFPLVGTGLGTFTDAEAMYRPLGSNQTIVHLHAHSEYIEALVEGGIIRFVLTIVLIWLVLRRGWQSLQSRQRNGEQAMLLGAWAACITLAIQSFGEFGVHLPAVAGVLAVTAGYLVALGGPRRTSDEPDPQLIRWNYFGVGPIVAFVFAGTLAVILFTGSWLSWQSVAFHERGLYARQTAKGNPVELQKAVQLLDAAIFYYPTHSNIRMDRYTVERQRLQVLENKERIALQRLAGVQHTLRLLLNNSGSWNNALCMTAEELITPMLTQLSHSCRYVHEQTQSWATQHRHLLAARDLNPLTWKPHLEIAEHVLPPKATLAPADRALYWKQSDPLDSYLNRVKLLQPNRAETWFLCGHLEGMAGLRDEALKSWRRSLEISDEFIEPIVQESTLDLLQPELRLNSQELMEKLLPPDSPHLLVKAAWALYPTTKEVEQRKPFMEKAIAILEKRKDVLSPENQYTYGLALWGVDRREQGLEHLISSTRAQPGRVVWRMDLARLYFELEKYADAREQLGLVLRAQPNNVEAAELLNKLDKIQRP